MIFNLQKRSKNRKLGASPDGSWHYQTGDNSYSGGAYGHASWGVVSLYRRSKSDELADDIREQLADAFAGMGEK